MAADHFWDRRGLKYAAGVLLVLAVMASRRDVGAWAVLGALVLLIHTLGLWRWTRALKGEATA